MKNHELNEDLYFPVYNWMKDLKLKTSELITYAVVYSYSSNGKKYRGSLDYISLRTGYTRKTLWIILNQLYRKGFLKKRTYKKQGGIKFTTYEHNPKKLEELSIEIPQKAKYFSIYQWMVDKLKLSRNELLMYAIVYSFTRNRHTFVGGLDYFTQKTNMSYSTASRTLEKLQKLGLIEKKERRKGLKKVLTLYAFDSLRSIDTKENDYDDFQHDFDSTDIDDNDISSYSHNEYVSTHEPYNSNSYHRTPILQSETKENISAIFIQMNKKIDKIVNFFMGIIDEYKQITKSMLEDIKNLNNKIRQQQPVHAQITKSKKRNNPIPYNVILKRE